MGFKYSTLKMPFWHFNATFRCFKCQNYFMKLEIGNLCILHVNRGAFCSFKTVYSMHLLTRYRTKMTSSKNYYWSSWQTALVQNCIWYVKKPILITFINSNSQMCIFVPWNNKWWNSKTLTKVCVVFFFFCRSIVFK